MQKIQAAIPKITFSPNYPTKLEIKSNPELLRKHLPPGWVRFLGMSGASGVLAIQLYGCAPPPVNPGIYPGPYFYFPISEEEGLAIIKEELAKKGISFSQNNVEWSEVIFTNANNTSIPLKVDLIDPDHKIAVEYVNGSSDITDLNGTPFNLKPTAENVERAVTEKGPKDFYFKALYSPAIMSDNQGIYRQQTEEDAKENLRQQVTDFVNWLKAQGVI